MDKSCPRYHQKCPREFTLRKCPVEFAHFEKKCPREVSIQYIKFYLIGKGVSFNYPTLISLKFDTFEFPSQSSALTMVNKCQIS